MENPNNIFAQIQKRKITVPENAYFDAMADSIVMRDEKDPNQFKLTLARKKKEVDAQEHLVKQVLKYVEQLSKRYPRANIVCIIQSALSDKFLANSVRHATNVPVWDDTLRDEIMRLILEKNVDPTASIENLKVIGAGDAVGFLEGIQEAYKRGILSSTQMTQLQTMNETIRKGNTTNFIVTPPSLLTPGFFTLQT